MWPATRPPGDDAGLTLVEVLVAVAILGIGVVSVLGGLMTSIKVSSDGQTTTEVRNALRSYAEAVTAATYVDCAPDSTYAAAAVGFTPPAGASADDVVSYLASASAASAAFGTDCSSDAGLQRVALTVTTADGGAQSLSVVKRRPS
jgi:prepilin-type N-terminal cleavage/methylation domain-containing protein